MLQRLLHAILPAALLACLTLLNAGCGLDYYVPLVRGTFDSVFRARPVTAVLADPSVPEATKAKLRLVQEIREFARTEIGQSVGSAYSHYDDDSAVSATGTIGYSLSAAAKDGFTPYTWDYPFIGRAEYRGYFSLEQARAERDRLTEAGYDTSLSIISGFSTLGVLPDPVRSSQIELPDEALVELLLHELSHRTVFKPNDTLFNETMASAIGRQAARHFYRTRRPADAPETLVALAFYDDEDVVDEFVTRVFDELTAYYAQPIGRDEKIAGRQVRFDALAAIFEVDFRPRLSRPDQWRGPANLTLNNSIILSAARYRGNLPVYRRVLEKLDGRFADVWDVLRRASRQSDSLGWLERWLEGEADRVRPPPELQSCGATASDVP